jgi:hypothetical protein
MTSSKLEDLHRRLDQLQLLISSENRTNDPGSIERLAMFVMLNPDNILLAQIKLIADEHGRAEKLGELHSEHPNTDGGMLALYELGILEIGMGHRQDPANPQFRQKFLERARATLEKFIELYPGSFHIDQVKKNLDGLPAK